MRLPGPKFNYMETPVHHFFNGCHQTAVLRHRQRPIRQQSLGNSQFTFFPRHVPMLVPIKVWDKSLVRPIKSVCINLHRWGTGMIAECLDTRWRI
eukprot:1159441-Pelagomonas_calceolata.AAC.6